MSSSEEVSTHARTCLKTGVVFFQTNQTEQGHCRSNRAPVFPKKELLRLFVPFATRITKSCPFRFTSRIISTEVFPSKTLVDTSRPDFLKGSAMPSSASDFSLTSK